MIEVTVGDTVRWLNQDPLRHTTTSDTSVWSSSELSRGEQFAFVAGKPGRYGYHCSAHPVMRGTLLVR
ncbi:MAG TPA: hypothetical protein VFT29_12800 [Gemmatimonadaceae bacterium]|nr:hypothetical protein [Gemmatimonadaceae bacterium]